MAAMLVWPLQIYSGVADLLEEVPTVPGDRYI